MQFEQTKYAFKHDEVFELLTGQKGYAYQAPMSPVSVPTFDGDIYQEGIYPYYNSVNSTEKEVMLSQLQDAYCRMMNSDDEVLVWWALSSLFGQKLNEYKYKKSPFFIADQLLIKIKPYLLKHKEALTKAQAYGGCGYINGLWGDVLRHNKLLYKYCNYDLLGRSPWKKIISNYLTENVLF